MQAVPDAAEFDHGDHEDAASDQDEIHIPLGVTPVVHGAVVAFQIVTGIVVSVVIGKVLVVILSIFTIIIIVVFVVFLAESHADHDKHHEYEDFQGFHFPPPATYNATLFPTWGNQLCDIFRTLRDDLIMNSLNSGGNGKALWLQF